MIMTTGTTRTITFCSPDCINVNRVNSALPFAAVKPENVACKVMVDAGSVANILDETLYSRIGRLRLLPCKGCLRPYGDSKPLKVLGSYNLGVKTKRRIQVDRFHAVSGSYGALLGFEAATELGLVQVNLNSIQADKSERLKAEFPDLYTGALKT